MNFSLNYRPLRLGIVFASGVRKNKECNTKFYSMKDSLNANWVLSLRYRHTGVRGRMESRRDLY